MAKIQIEEILLYQEKIRNYRANRQAEINKGPAETTIVNSLRRHHRHSYLNVASPILPRPPLRLKEQAASLIFIPRRNLHDG